MYDNENRLRINWVDIIIKVILLALFLFILISLMPKNDLTPLYDQIYQDNINTMKEAAKNYYTIDRLPENVGDTKTMTLKEMIDNHLIIRFKDKNKKYCDESTSKVQVTKTSDQEYVLRVELNCGSQKDYILDTIGCYNVCKGNDCQIDKTTIIDEDKPLTTYYQHKKEIITTKTIYTCPEGYTKEGKKCYKSSTGATIDATPHYGANQTITTDALYTEGGQYTVYADPIKTEAGTTYTCPTGYTLNGSFCVKYTNAISTPKVSYTCPTGYILSGMNCIKKYNATQTTETTYSCPNGGELTSDHKCKVTIDATEKNKYTCPSGYSLNGTSCYKIYNATPKTTYSCPNGGELSGTKCVYKATSKVTYGNWILKEYKYYQTAQPTYVNETEKLEYLGTISGAVCGSPCGYTGIWYKYAYYTRTKKTTYSCPNGGELNGSKCYYNATKKTTYSCPNGGTLDGDKCVIKQNATLTTEYTCPNGYEKQGKKCIKYYNATATTNKVYTCPNGGTLSGTKCIITIGATVSVQNTYKCPPGTILSGNKCLIKIEANKETKYKYSCPEGFIESGTGENLKCYQIKYGEKQYYCENANAILQGKKCIITVPGSISYYTCPSNEYELQGSKCIKKSKEYIDATKSTSQSSSYKYIWSTQKYLEGWTFTGKTKTA